MAQLMEAGDREVLKLTSVMLAARDQVWVKCAALPAATAGEAAH